VPVRSGDVVEDLDGAVVAVDAKGHGRGAIKKGKEPGHVQHSGQAELAGDDRRVG
jgi:hypothetical protein